MFEKCKCQHICGDDGDIDGPGICKGLPPPPLEPVVKVVLVHRDARRYENGV